MTKKNGPGTRNNPPRNNTVRKQIERSLKTGLANGRKYIKRKSRQIPPNSMWSLDKSQIQGASQPSRYKSDLDKDILNKN